MKGFLSPCLVLSGEGRATRPPKAIPGRVRPAQAEASPCGASLATVSGQCGQTGVKRRRESETGWDQIPRDLTAHDCELGWHPRWSGAPWEALGSQRVCMWDSGGGAKCHVHLQVSHVCALHTSALPTRHLYALNVCPPHASVCLAHTNVSLTGLHALHVCKPHTMSKLDRPPWKLRRRTSTLTQVGTEKCQPRALTFLENVTSAKSLDEFVTVLKLQTTDNERLFCLNKFKNSVYQKVIKKKEAVLGEIWTGEKEEEELPPPPASTRQTPPARDICSFSLRTNGDHWESSTGKGREGRRMTGGDPSPGRDPLGSEPLSHSLGPAQELLYASSVALKKRYFMQTNDKNVGIAILTDKNRL